MQPAAHTAAEIGLGTSVVVAPLMWAGRGIGSLTMFRRDARGLQDKEMVAIIAYLMRLGVDGEAAIQAERTAQAAPAPAAAPAAGGN